MLPSSIGVIVVHEYLDAAGRSPFARWFERLNSVAAAKVSTSIYRLGEGNFSNVKGVGAGVFEISIDFGPGYRVYFGKDGDTVVVLLGGSVKKNQTDGIARAIGAWVAYKASKRLLRK